MTFWGAAQTVTGSLHLVEVGGERIVLDCGLNRTRNHHAAVRAEEFPCPASYIDAVVLSHAHIDHCGNLPNLVREGFTGPIYCTPATRDLIALMLSDAARIQEEEAHVDGIIHASHAPHHPVVLARNIIQQVLRQCVPLEYGQRASISRQAEVCLIDAGHILGSAIVSLTLAGRRRDVTLTFTGDIGRRGLPFLHDAAAIPPADLVICESTYGGRRHQTVASMADALAFVVNRSAGEGGTILIPAFSLGRTQLVVHYLRQWMRQRMLPSLPVFVDSPLAAGIAEVYSQYPQHFSDGHESAGGIGEEKVRYIRSPAESDELLEHSGPRFVVASGGMCDGGRIVKHLRRHVDDPRATLVLVSYQAPDTLGRRMLERSPNVHFHGRRWNKWIDVVELNGFSGHADHDDLLDYLGPLAGRAGKIRLVHGEPAAGLVLANDLLGRGFDDVGVPARGETVTIEPLAA